MPLFSKARRQPPELLIRIYEHDECELCRRLVEELSQRRLSFPYTLERMDIHRHPTFRHRYGLRVPVVEIGGVYELEAPVGYKEIETAIQNYQWYLRQQAIYRKRWRFLARVEWDSTEKGRVARLRMRFAAHVLDRFKTQAGLRVLELASGPGVNQRWYPPSWEVTVIDWTPVYFRAFPAAFEGAQRVVADAHALPFGDARFDLVVSTFSNCAFFNPRRIVDEVARVLVDGGSWVTMDHGAGPRPISWIQKAFRPLWFRWVGCFPDRSIPDVLAEPPFFEWDVERIWGGLLVFMFGRRRPRPKGASAEHAP